MKSIELTEDHKNKLLEMCKTLFPKFKFSIEIEDSSDGIHPVDYLYAEFQKLNNESKTTKKSS